MVDLRRALLEGQGVKTFLMTIVGLSVAGMTPVAADGPPSAFFEALRAADRQLATVGRRLTVSNVVLCDRRMPALGWALHSFQQYQPEVRSTVKQIFGFETPVSVEAVVKGGAADRSGIRDNDSLIAVGSTSLTASVVGATSQTADRDRALTAIEALPPEGAVTVIIVRAGQRLHATLSPEAACRSRFEIVVGNGFDAQADGGNVQLGERFFEGFSEEEIAVVVAHELAHNILHHRERLDAAKVSRGIVAEFGRNGRLIRRTEDEADQLSVYLLANAGYDPFAAGRFWRTRGAKLGDGIFRSRTHGSAAARARAVDEIAATVAGQSARPIIPTMIATRDQPLS